MLASALCCFTRHAEASGTPVHGLLNPDPDTNIYSYTATNWTTNEGETLKQKAPCHLLISSGRGTYVYSMSETGSKAANPPLVNVYVFKNMKLGMPQKSRPLKLCKCGESYNNHTSNVIVIFAPSLPMTVQRWDKILK